MVAMMTLTLSLVACEDKPEPEPQPVPPTPEELTFEVETVSVSKNDATFNITPSNLEADYLAVILDAKSAEAFNSDAEIITKIYNDVKSYAEANGTTFEAYMADKVKRGALEGHKVEQLYAGTNYYLLVFGVDVNNDLALTGKVCKHEFATEANAQPQPSSCTFEIKANVHLTNVALNVKPSDNNQLWHLINVAVEEYQTYTSAEGEYGWTKEEYFQNYLNTEISTLKEQGLSAEEIGIKLFHKGMRTLNDSGLQPKTKYVTFAGAVDYTNGAAVVTSALKELRYNSGEAAESALTFDIDVFNISNYSAEVRITPSDLNANYYYYIGYIDSQKKSMKPIDIANAAVTEYIYYWENYTELKHRDPVTGVVDLTGENKVELNIAETEYFIVAFSFEPNPTYGTIINEETGEYDYNPGTITSVPVYVSFKTLNHGDPMAVEFKFSASDVGPYDLNLEIESSDSSVFYQPGLAYAEGFDPEAAMAASANQLAMVMQMCMEGQSPCLTFQEAFDKLKKQGYPYRNGNAKFYIANLAPEKEIIGYVLAIDMKTGKFAKCYYSDVIAKTTSKGTITPTVEVLGIFNGDEENGTIFGDASRTAGKPIVAVTHKNVEGASALYTALTEDSFIDVNSYSDNYIIADFRGYWNEVDSISVPYYFFLAKWDLEQTIVSYAQDANGHEGGVSRLAVTPVEYNDDLSVLKGYVDAVNNATAVPQSLVVSEPTAEPTIECIWSQEVEPISGFEVIYHEVDFDVATVDSDLVEVKVVKSFAF